MPRFPIFLETAVILQRTVLEKESVSFFCQINFTPVHSYVPESFSISAANTCTLPPDMTAVKYPLKKGETPSTAPVPASTMITLGCNGNKEVKIGGVKPGGLIYFCNESGEIVGVSSREKIEASCGQK